jgi:hypothetical protein
MGTLASLPKIIYGSLGGVSTELNREIVIFRNDLTITNE